MNARDERLVGLEHWLLHAVAESLRHPRWQSRPAAGSDENFSSWPLRESVLRPANRC